MKPFSLSLPPLALLGSLPVSLLVEGFEEGAGQPAGVALAGAKAAWGSCEVGAWEREDCSLTPLRYIKYCENRYKDRESPSSALDSNTPAAFEELH